jgi:hypothetical protein
MAQTKFSVTLHLGHYSTQNHHETALVEPLDRLSTYVWTTSYQTPGFTSETVSEIPKAVGSEDPESNKENWM